MTLPPFALHRPRSVPEAEELLARYGDDAALYCGGTELLLVMKLGLASYPNLVDLKGIPELHVLEEREGELRVGAAVTHHQLECSPLVRRLVPPLAEMERRVANVRVRSVGTLGGNLCFSDPHSDPATFLLASGAELVCRRGSAERTISIGEFVRGPYETALEPKELLTEIRIPALPAGTALAHEKFSMHERPALTVSCFMRAEDSRVAEARIAVGSVSAIPARVLDAESALVGLSPRSDAERLETAGEIAADAVSPFADLNGSVEYKRNLVRVFVSRCCATAMERVFPA
ncbi:MAG: xanthine dehydrogenase family protein subunit M [Actinobacteria bacterium]|nr:MAG: xanthine dehydrogenase family protein subunit M [Actinomycetota bacterium]